MKEKTAVHIISDDKFIDAAINIFNDVVFFKHDFFCFKPDGNIKYIKQINKVTLFKIEEDLIGKINSSADMVFLHGLCINPRHLLNINSKIKITWITWGYDIYSDKSVFNEKKLLNIRKFKPHTRKYIRFHEKINFIHLFKYYIRLLLNKNYYLKFAARANFISTALPFEFNLIMKKNNLSAKYLFFRYSFKEESSVITGDKILLGNSAAPGNNHIDVLHVLNKINLTGRIIIMPLSYSGDESYKNYLRKYLNSIENITIKPLWDFMPLNEYNNLLGTCQYAIFGHLRQQALYNIFQVLFNGVKIFFYKDSIAYKALKEDGYILFTIEDDLDFLSLNTPLSEDEKLYNKNLYLKNNNYNNYIKNLNTELQKIFDIK